MSLGTLVTKFGQNVKLPAWLAFVGAALALIAFYFLPAQTTLEHLAKGIGVVGGFVSIAGTAYNVLYP